MTRSNTPNLTRQNMSRTSSQTAKSNGGQIPAGSRASRTDAQTQFQGSGRHVPTGPKR